MASGAWTARRTWIPIRAMTSLPRPPQFLVTLQQGLHVGKWNAPAIGDAEPDVFLVRPVEVAAAGLEQAEAVGQLGVLLDEGGVVVAVNRFDADQAEIF